MAAANVSYFQFNVKIDTAIDKDLVDFLVFVRRNRKLNSVVRRALYLYMKSEQYDLFTQINDSIEMSDALLQMGITNSILKK